jgi:hypothetical protein
MRWEGLVACMGKKGNAYTVLAWKSVEKGHLDDPDL